MNGSSYALFEHVTAYSVTPTVAPEASPAISPTATPAPTAMPEASVTPKPTPGFGVMMALAAILAMRYSGR